VAKVHPFSLRSWEGRMERACPTRSLRPYQGGQLQQFCRSTKQRRRGSVKRRASNRKVAKPWFDSRCGSASLCPWEKHSMLFPTWGQAVYPLWWPSLTKDMQTEQLCVGVVWQTQSIVQYLVQTKKKISPKPIKLLWNI